jgi:hypothetical protein
MEQRDYTKFHTPDETADLMVGLADIAPGMFVQEPHAGDGQIIRAIRRKYGTSVIVDCVELKKEHAERLALTKPRYTCFGDYLQYQLPVTRYDRIVANPPFGNGVDLAAHFAHMWGFLKSGGNIVSLIPKGFNPFAVPGIDPNEYSIAAGQSVQRYPLENWSKNSDGSFTEVELIKIVKP